MNAYRLLPSIDALLTRPRVDALSARHGRERVRAELESALGVLRSEIQSGLDAEQLRAALEAGRVEQLVEEALAADARRGLVRAINATGVVLHTGLGRAPVHPAAAEAMREAAQSFCVLEVDRHSGARGQRDARLSELLARLTGAEAGIAVNNNAAACLLTLAALSGERETIVSRGELVEIGGSFRVPDVMSMAGARLVEVGTTNRTRIGDYAAAIGERTGCLMKVHRSNFRIEGFTEEVESEELAQLGRERGVWSAFDLGSGLVEGPNAAPLVGLEGETRVRAAVEAGLDVVSFSGDKLCGAPQAGLLAGTKRAMQALRKNPLYRALRLDKAAIAGLETSLELYLAGRGDEIPTRAMLHATRAEVRARAEAIAAQLAGVGALEIQVVDSMGQPGSGSAPGIELESAALRIQSPGRTPDQLANALRAGDPPIFARVQDGALLCDPRTLLPGEDQELVSALRAL